MTTVYATLDSTAAGTIPAGAQLRAFDSRGRAEAWLRSACDAEAMDYGLADRVEIEVRRAAVGGQDHDVLVLVTVEAEG